MMPKIAARQVTGACDSLVSEPVPRVDLPGDSQPNP